MKLVELPDEIAEVLENIPVKKRGDFLKQHGLKLSSANSSSEKIAKIYSDGASRGNPGKAGAGFFIEDSEGNILFEGTKYLGKTTNNVAEWTALLLSLEAAKEKKIQKVHCFLDSELVVKQMNGEYRVRHPHLLPLFEKVKKMSREFSEIRFSHIPREKNTHADRLSNEAIEKSITNRSITNYE